MNMADLTLTHNGETIRFADLPASTQARYVQEGFTHFYGNRVASAVVGDFRAAARKEWKATNGDEAWAALSDSAKAAIEKAGIPDSESEAYRAAIAAERDAHWQAAKAGTLGEGRGPAAPKLTPLEAECAAIAKRETIEILTKQGLFVASAKRRVPKADDTFDLKGESVSFGDLCVRRFARFHERIVKEAKATIKARESAAAKVSGEELAEAF